MSLLLKHEILTGDIDGCQKNTLLKGQLIHFFKFRKNVILY